MIGFPPAKLNLGLQIIAKRTDGFHDLQTVFYQFPLNDVLEIIKDDSLDQTKSKIREIIEKSKIQPKKNVFESILDNFF